MHHATIPPPSFLNHGPTNPVDSKSIPSEVMKLEAMFRLARSINVHASNLENTTISKTNLTIVSTLPVPYGTPTLRQCSTTKAIPHQQWFIKKHAYQGSVVPSLSTRSAINIPMYIFVNVSLSHVIMTTPRMSTNINVQRGFTNVSLCGLINVVASSSKISALGILCSQGKTRTICYRWVCLTSCRACRVSLGVVMESREDHHPEWEEKHKWGWWWLDSDDPQYRVFGWPWSGIGELFGRWMLSGLLGREDAMFVGMVWIARLRWRSCVLGRCVEWLVWGDRWGWNLWSM